MGIQRTVKEQMKKSPYNSQPQELVEEKAQQKELVCECLGPQSLWAVRALWATLAGSLRADFTEGHTDAWGVNRVPPPTAVKRSVAWPGPPPPSHHGDSVIQQ